MTNRRRWTCAKPDRVRHGSLLGIHRPASDLVIPDTPGVRPGSDHVDDSFLILIKRQDQNNKLKCKCRCKTQDMVKTFEAFPLI